MSRFPAPGELPGRVHPAPAGLPPAAAPAAVVQPAPSAAEVLLAWSASRRRLLASCERAYFWQYLGSRGGHADAAPRAARRAWQLKHLTALPLLIGQVVHNAAYALGVALRDGREPPPEAEALAGARRALNQVWWISTHDQDRFWRWPGTYTALREVVYRGRLQPTEIARARERLERCIAGLYGMPLLDALAAALAADGPDAVRIGPAVPDLFRAAALPGAPLVWVASDLTYRHHDVAGLARMTGLAFEGPVWCITEYKTGNPAPEDERLQLAAYALQARDVFALPMTSARPVAHPPAPGDPAGLAGRPNAGGPAHAAAPGGGPPAGWSSDGARPAYVGRVVYLARESEAWTAITDADIDALGAVVTTDVARMRAMLSAPERGLAWPVQAYALAADRRACGRCGFLELCRDELRPLRDRIASLRERTGGQPDVSEPSDTR